MDRRVAGSWLVLFLIRNCTDDTCVGRYPETGVQHLVVPVLSMDPCLRRGLRVLEVGDGRLTNPVPCAGHTGNFGLLLR